MSAPHIELSGEKLFEVFNFQVTGTLLVALALASGIFIVFTFVGRKLKMRPGPGQNFFEWILETFYNFVHSITNNSEKTKEIFPLAVTLFLLILASNLLGLLPGQGVFNSKRPPSSDLNFTLALAITAIFYVNLLALKKLGAFQYLGKFFNFKNPILFFVGILELLSEFVRILSLAVRLFGNLFAGKVLLLIVSFLAPYIMPLPFLGIEILVGLVQAFIFSSLVVIFYATATAIDHGAH